MNSYIIEQFYTLLQILIQVVHRTPGFFIPVNVPNLLIIPIFISVNPDAIIASHIFYVIIQGLKLSIYPPKLSRTIITKVIYDIIIHLTLLKVGISLLNLLDNNNFIFQKCIMKTVLIQQYYIPKNNDRKKEVQFCLKCNLNNKFIQTIYLLNEREYTLSELGIPVNSKWHSLAKQKIKQINIHSRLTYYSAFQHMIQQNQVQPSNDTYYILSNSDIFFDSTLKLLPNYTHAKKRFSICLGRYEYNKNIQRLHQCNMTHSIKYGWSQDAWIFHSCHLPIIQGKYKNMTQFHLGKPGCDNRIAKLLEDMGLRPINPCKKLKSYHYHSCGYRTYSNRDRIPGATKCIMPS